jgi:hypothetical protein
MSEFKLPNAVTLFSQEKTTITSLWTVYAAATFAAAGYGLSTPSLNAFSASAITVGFAAFAFGNWKLLKQSLTINRTLRDDILTALVSDSDNQFRSSIKALVGRANPPWISFTIHLLIDLCVIVALWSRMGIGRPLGHGLP